MSILEWAELHGETGDDREIYAQTKTSYNTLINEHVDYEVIVDIRVLSDGTRICEVEDELLLVYDDAGNIHDSFSVSLPSKYVQEALERAEDEDVF
jgi:hypothetical protein